jgi:hypothetical protein
MVNLFRHTLAASLADELGLAQYREPPAHPSPTA